MTDFNMENRKLSIYKSSYSYFNCQKLYIVYLYPINKLFVYLPP